MQQHMSLGRGSDLDRTSPVVKPRDSSLPAFYPDQAVVGLYSALYVSQELHHAVSSLRFSRQNPFCSQYYLTKELFRSNVLLRGESHTYIEYGLQTQERIGNNA